MLIADCLADPTQSSIHRKLYNTPVLATYSLPRSSVFEIEMAHLSTEVYLANSFMQSGDASPSTPKLQLQLSIPIPSRDPTFYIPDGNTVLLVENILFKVTLFLDPRWTRN